MWFCFFKLVKIYKMIYNLFGEAFRIDDRKIETHLDSREKIYFPILFSRDSHVCLALRAFSTSV